MYKCISSIPQKQWMYKSADLLHFLPPASPRGWVSQYPIFRSNKYHILLLAKLFWLLSKQFSDEKQEFKLVTCIFQQNKSWLITILCIIGWCSDIKESGLEMQRKTGVTLLKWIFRQTKLLCFIHFFHQTVEQGVLHTRALSLDEKVRLKNS